jgi:hypothetical protein
MAAIMMCAPNVPGVALNRQIVAPSGTTYTLGPQGTVLVAQADVPFFVQQGFSPGPPFGAAILYTTGPLTGVTSVPIGTLPAGAYIREIIIVNSTGNAVSGGIKFGTASGLADIVAAQPVAGNAVPVVVADASLAKRAFSTTAPQPIFATAATDWASANVTITVIWGWF